MKKTNTRKKNLKPGELQKPSEQQPTGQRAAEGHWQVLSGLGDICLPQKKALDCSDIYNGFCPLQLSNYLCILTPTKQSCVPPASLLMQTL